MIEAIGWIGNILCGMCGFPQAYKSFVEGHSRGLADGFLAMWLIGEILGLIYIIIKHQELNLAPVLFNYGCNMFALVVILYYRFFERIMHS